MHVTTAVTGEELNAFCRWQPPGAAQLTPGKASMRQADAHLLIRDGPGAVPRARCSLWRQAAPAYAAHKLGLIGHYAAQDDTAATMLLEHACRRLAQQGCTLAVGPLDGSTFRAYRFVTQRACDGVTRPPFFLEPDNPDVWPAQFIQAGFAPLAHYFSAIARLPASEPRLPALAAHSAEAGIRLRPLDPADFERELEAIYDVVAAGFAGNFLYTPLARAEFLAQYAPIRPHIRPETALIAEQAGRAVGFAFALPDLAQAQRGEPMDTLILKTIAVRPEAAGLGLGSLLAARVHEAASELGFHHVIHALMHADNRSRRISAHYQAAEMRRYTLFSCPLDADVGAPAPSPQKSKASCRSRKPVLRLRCERCGLPRGQSYTAISSATDSFSKRLMTVCAAASSNSTSGGRSRFQAASCR